MTDYESLGTFIPSLVENRCLERRQGGALLYQVGAQDVALGVKFRAACKLEIKEHPNGLPRHACAGGGGAAAAPGSANARAAAAGGLSSRRRAPADDHAHLFPWPTSTLPHAPVHGDITFDMLEGDFDAFRGVWRMQPGLQGPGSCWLVYALYVRPQAWLPLGMVQGRIGQQIVSNLQAVQRHSEQRHQRRLQQQRQQQQQ